MGRNPEIGSRVASPTQVLSLPTAVVSKLFAESGAQSWNLTPELFSAALGRSARKHFGESPVNLGKLEDYLASLHLQDLALACACAGGSSQAWEHFFSTYQNYLRSAAAAILRCPAASPAAQELADSLFADLYGLTERKNSDRSLFRYFHGRSSLKTWLRAVLAQRHIDSIRAGRRFTELAQNDGEPFQPGLAMTQTPHDEMPRDPHRERYVALFTRTLQVELGLLDPRDKERLRLYYSEEQTLAEIGRRFGEHESSISRNLDRTRRELRAQVEQALRKGQAALNGLPAEPGLSEEEISLCFEYAAEDAPIDLEKLLPQPAKIAVKPEKKQV